MNIFDLFDTANVNGLLSYLSKDKLSDNDVVVNKLDFTKKEDLDTLIEAVDTFKKTDNGLIGLAKTFIGDSYNEILDNVVKAAQQEYAKAHKDDTVKPTNNVLSGATVTRKEVDKSSEEKTVPSRPSDKTPEETQNQIHKLVKEYIAEKIEPTVELTGEQYESIGDGLFEFACWVYNR